MNPLMSLPIRTVTTAYAALSGDQSGVTKQHAADWLTSCGYDNAAVTAAAAGKPHAVQAPSRAQQTIATQMDANRLKNLENEAARLADSITAQGVTVSACRDALATLDRKTASVHAAATAQANTLGVMERRLDALGTTLNDRLDRAEAAAHQASKAATVTLDPAAAQAAIVDEVRRAFGPFEAAVAAAGAQAQVQQAAAAKVVEQRTALEVFGIEVKDRKGNPLMFDIWDDPTAPAVDPFHLWSEPMVKAMHRAAKHGPRGNVWLGGLKGAGKSTTLQQFAARTGRAFCRINFHQHTAADEYIGAQGLSAGSTGFQPADFLLAYTRPGAVLCLDEITNTHPGSLAPLNGLLEPGARVSIGGSVWTRAPGVVIGAADNTSGTGDATGRHAGTREMNSALMDRFAFKEWCTFLPRDLERRALVSRTGASDKLVDHVLDAVDACRAKVQTGEIIDPPSIRSVEAFILALETEPVRDAWVRTIAAAQPAESAVGLEAVYTACINPNTINRSL